MSSFNDLSIFEIIVIGLIEIIIGFIIFKIVHRINSLRKNYSYNKDSYWDTDGSRSKLEQDTGVSISKYVRVIRLNTKMPSSLELQLPTWEHARMNGVADARMKVNKKIYHDSTLILSNYKMTSRDPSIMLDLANQFRERGFSIPLSKMESQVLKNITTETSDNEFMNYNEELAMDYTNDQTAFMYYCIDRFRKSGYGIINRNSIGDFVIVHDDITRRLICVCLLPNQKLALPRVRKLIKDNRNQHLFIVTNSTFTDNAKEYCRLNDSTIMDGRGLLELMSKPKKIQDTVDPSLLRTLLPTDMDKDVLEF